MNADAAAGKIGALAESGSAEVESELADPLGPTRVYPTPSQVGLTRAGDEGDAVQPRLLPESGPSGAPSKVGRYVVLGVLGIGGMGVVCTAYDPKLDRKVALKLLRRRVGRASSTSSTGRARLVREAQALAKLSHPNIVTVHDVDTTEDGRIYMAMEFVHGQTITQWLFARKPPWREILGVFEQAGTGLAAAHQANITHRDFKPANVLIGEDGRVKVLDFGLAKSETGPLSTDSDDGHREPGSGEDIMQVVQSTGDMKLTMAGRIVGTPAYMAPEQRRGRATGPATDQFSFAVALYEALFGRLPFRSESHSRDAARGRVIDPPSETDVPSWVFRALRRSLAPQPNDRYPTMEALLAALRADPARRLRKIALWSAGALAVGGTCTAAVLALTPDDEICDGARARLDGVWGPQPRAAVDAALRDTATAYAAYTAQRVLEDVDAYADSWASARTIVCEATWVHGEQSESTLDVRMHCLDQRQGELRALLDVLADADGEVVERAVQAVASLTGPETCVTADPATSRQLPEDPVARSQALAAQARIDDAEALLRAGRYTVAHDAAVEALSLSSGPPVHGPTHARALYVHGLVAQRRGDAVLAQARFEEAAREAASVGTPALEAKALISHVRVQGVYLHNRERALGIAVGAHSAIARAGAPPDLQAELAQQLGAIAMAAREDAEGIEQLHIALEAAEKSYPPRDVRFAPILASLGVALAQQGESVEAEAYLRRALGLHETSQGLFHPDVASVAQNLANVLATRANGLTEATELIARAMTIRLAVFGPDHSKVADLWATQGRLRVLSEESDAALSDYRRAAEIYRKAENTSRLASTLFLIAKLHHDSGAFEPAAEAASEALALFSGTSKADRQSAGKAGIVLCLAELELGRLDAALAHCEDAVGAIREARGERGDDYSHALRELARVHRKRREFDRALEAARRSVAAAESSAMRGGATDLLSTLEAER